MCVILLGCIQIWHFYRTLFRGLLFSGHSVYTQIYLHAHTHSLTHHFNGCFPDDPALASCHLHFPSPFVSNLCILLQQVKTFHIVHEHHHAKSVLMSSVHMVSYLHPHTTLEPISIIWIYLSNHPADWLRYQQHQPFFRCKTNSSHSSQLY